MVQIRVAAAFLSLLLIAVISVPAHAAPAEDEGLDLPEAHVMDDVQMLVIADLEQLGPDAIAGAVDRLFATVEPLDQDMLDTMRAEMDEKIKAYGKQWHAVTNAGARRLLIVSGGVWAGIEVEAGDGEQDDPPDEQKKEAMAFLQVAPGTDKEALTEVLYEIGEENKNENKNENEDENADENADADANAEAEAEAEAEAKDVKLVRINDRWMQLVGRGLLEPRQEQGEPDALNPFREKLTALDGAAARLVLVTSPEWDRMLRKAMTSGSGAMFSMVLDPLRSMEAVSAGVWLDDDPRVKVGLVFADQAPAMQFKQGISGLTMFVNMLTAMAGSQDQQPDTPRTRLAADAREELKAALLLKQEGATVSQTLGRHFFAAIIELEMIDRLKTRDEAEKDEADPAATQPAE